MTPEQERELIEIAQNTSNAVLHRLMEIKWRSGMPEDDWVMLAIKTLAEAQTQATQMAIDAMMRAPMPQFIVQDKAAR